MTNWIERLKTKWNLTSAWQVVMVLLVFSCTGVTVLLLKKPVLNFLSGEEGNSATASVLYYVFILPVYNLLLLGYGFVFGQFRFFWNFEKRFVKRMLPVFKNQRPEEQSSDDNN